MLVMPARAQTATAQDDAATADSVQLSKVTVDGVYFNRIDVNLNDQSLLATPGVALDDPERRKTFKDFVTDYHPLAQITGTFFDLHSGEPIGDIVVRGRQLFFTRGIGSALVVTPDNKAAIVDTPSNEGWAGYESVLQGGVRLVRGGQAVCDTRAQGFHDHYMERLTSRVVVCLWPGNQLVLMSTGRVLLPDLADILVKMGCLDAMALDGGGSTGIAFKGRQLYSTGRKLANVLMVVRRTPEEIAAREEAARVAAAAVPTPSTPPAASPANSGGFIAAVGDFFRNGIGAMWSSLCTWGNALTASLHPPLAAIGNWFSHLCHPGQPVLESRKLTD